VVDVSAMVEAEDILTITVEDVAGRISISQDVDSMVDSNSRQLLMDITLDQ